MSETKLRIFELKEQHSPTYPQPAMGSFEYGCYVLDKALMKLYKQWPKQGTRVRVFIITVLLAISTTFVIPQLIALSNSLNEFNILLESVISLIFGIYNGVKFFFAAFTPQKMSIVLNHIRMDRKIWSQDRDANILHEYTQKGKKMVFFYAVGSYATLAIFILAPIIPKTIDILLRNGTEPGQFPIPLDYYYIDMQKYYFYIILHCFLCSILGLIFPLSYSCMFIVLVQHGCGLFSALGRKLQRIGTTGKSSVIKESAHTLNNQNVDFMNLAWCINRHHDAIEYAKLIETTYSWCFFILTGINVFAISMSAFQITKKTVDRQQTVRFIVITLFCTMHLYIDNSLAQLLMDHSINIRYCILNGEWYNYPLTTQKLLLLMLMRCNIPCKLTAGKITILSIETFGKFLKSSISYFTLLRSIS